MSIRRLFLQKQDTGGGLLLDSYPNASAAYSLRYLNSAYGGGVVRVRRDSDNVEQDFTPSQITDGTLLTFTGSGDGFVTTWYDQSGNLNNAILSLGSECIIVLLGVLVTNNGLPSTFTNTTTIYYTNDNINSNIFSMVSVSFNNDTSGTNEVFGISSGLNDASSFLQAADNSLRFKGDFQSGSISASISNKLRFTFRNVNQLNDYINNAENINTIKVIPNTNGILKLNIDNFRGYTQECIFWNSDEIANRTAIQDNINTYYNIY